MQAGLSREISVWKSCRGTSVLLSVSAGASVQALQRMLGHEQPSVTLDVYADLFDQDLDVLADSMTSARARGLGDHLRISGNVLPPQSRSSSA